MSTNNKTTNRNTQSVQFVEDPRREPHEKETAIHVQGDGTHAVVTSFKKVVFAKLLRRPEFEVKQLTVLDSEDGQRTVDSFETARDQSLTIIGVVGRLPVGAINIGNARNNNSHADIVK